MKLEEILKADGWPDADIAALQPMLTNQAFRASMEKQYGAVASERDQLKQRDGQWQEKLDSEWQPRVSGMERDLTAARLELAQANERIKLAKEFGYLTEQQDAEATAAAAKAKLDAAGAFDPKKFVSMEDAQRMLEGEGRAIVMVADLNNEYGYLTGGKSLYEYEAQVGDRNLRGFTALREEAKQKRLSLDAYVTEKFDFTGKRTALQQKRQQEHDDVIRKEAEDKVRNELASQYGNPLMRTAVPSRFPTLVPKPANGKHPWEVNKQQLKSERLERAMKAQLTGAA